MNNFSGIPIKEFWGFKLGEFAQMQITGQNVQLMEVPAALCFSGWRNEAYRVTQETALNAFCAAVRIGASAENEQEVKTLWLNFFQEFGIPFKMDNDAMMIRMRPSQIVAMPINAHAAHTIAQALKSDDIKTIQRLAHYHEYIETHGERQGQMLWKVTFADYQPYSNLDKTMQTYDLIYHVGINSSLAKSRNDTWLLVARRWLEQTVSHYTGTMTVTIQEGNLILQHDSLLSAMWFAFWNSTQLYPHPIIKFCRKCEQPIETDSTRRQLCDDCKRKNDTLRRAKNRALSKAKKNNSNYFDPVNFE